MLRPSRLSLDFFRAQLASVDALPQLAVLALITGCVTGLVILLFRITIELTLDQFLPGHNENFEGLSKQLQFFLPLFGASILGLLLTFMPAQDTRAGIVHVLERLGGHQGHLPLKNALVQFLAGAFALITGQSAGREGPAIHLGAAASSLLGQFFKLPNNSIRTLVACGAAAAIAGSFNTPVAGVIFAMEVIVMEYSIASFIPVILAAVTTTLITRLTYGADPAFIVPQLSMQSLVEIPYVIVAGIIIGATAAGFINLLQAFAKLNSLPFWQRGIIAGLITGTAAMIAPAVLGIGYDTVNAAMLGQLSFITLGTIVVLKIVTSSAFVGLGLPAGIIGPTLVTGASLGGILGLIISGLIPEQAASPGFYVMLGMSAMMAAVLQAPLAALMTVLELTANPNIILPAMLIIVAATMTTSELFKKKSIVLTTLHTLGLQYPPDPLTLHLQRAGVASVMRRDIVVLNQIISLQEAQTALENNPGMIVVMVNSQPACVLATRDLVLHIDSMNAAPPLLADANLDSNTTNSTSASKPESELVPDKKIVDLMEIPGMRMDLASVSIQATLLEAVQELNKSGLEALCITHTSAPMINRVVGILTHNEIDLYSHTSV
ncbi:MAG: chloride channel protein [Pseudomonadales bacterium]|nr:chloride channel protein [Pseudomonadales bacterium]